MIGIIRLNHSTRLITSVLADDPQSMLDRAMRALAGGADLIELRLDYLEHSYDGIPAVIRKLPPRRWIATCRPIEQGGRFEGNASEQASLLLAAGRAAEGFVDCEFSTWGASANIRRKIALATGVRRPRTADEGRLIISDHNLTGKAADLSARLRRMADAHPTAILKTAWQPDDFVDSIEALNLVRESSRPIMAMCLGDAGALTRILAPKFGAWGAYCALNAGLETAPGQLTLSDMRSIYRWKEINRDTQWYGVMGDPVGHSIGPNVFNPLFREFGMNAVYLRLPVSREGDCLSRCLDALQYDPRLGFAGASVTIPHKERVAQLFPWDERYERIESVSGAANTIIAHPHGWMVRNTDHIAFSQCVYERLDLRPTHTLRDKRVLVLGAGGAARAVIACAKGLKATVVCANRTADRGFAVAGQLGATYVPWEDRDQVDADILVNATSVGQIPDIDATPFPASRLNRFGLVVDFVYRPRETKLLRDAQSAGCRAVDGLDLYVAQAAAQFQAWHGKVEQVMDIQGLIRERAESVFAQDR